MSLKTKKHKKSSTSVAQGADKYETAFNKTRSAREGLAAESLVARNVDVGGTIAIVLNVIPSMRTYRDELVENFPRLDIGSFDALEDYADAVFHAQGMMTMPQTDGLDGLYDVVIHQREMLSSDVKALIKRGLVEEETLQDVTNLAGYKNVALDVNRLCTIARERWDAISNKTALTIDEVEKARSDAGQLLILSGARETTASQAKDDLHRALTLLVRGYEGARDAIAYLRRNEGDINSIAPSLFANRGGRRKADAGASGATPAPPVAVPVTPAPPVAAPVAPAPVIATPAPAPVVAGSETPTPAPVAPIAPSSDVQLTQIARKSA